MSTSLTGYVNRSYDNAISVIDLVMKTVDTYWTPATGHLVSYRSTCEKLADWLTVARSGLKAACSKEEELQWFILECTLLAIERDVKYKHQQQLTAVV